MAKQRRIAGEGKGVALTVWVSETTRRNLECEAARQGKKRATLAREIIESQFGHIRPLCRSGR